MNKRVKSVSILFIAVLIVICFVTGLLVKDIVIRYIMLHIYAALVGLIFLILKKAKLSNAIAVLILLLIFDFDQFSPIPSDPGTRSLISLLLSIVLFIIVMYQETRNKSK